MNNFSFQKGGSQCTQKKLINSFNFLSFSLDFFLVVPGSYIYTMSRKMKGKEKKVRNIANWRWDHVSRPMASSARSKAGNFIYSHERFFSSFLFLSIDISFFGRIFCVFSESTICEHKKKFCEFFLPDSMSLSFEFVNLSRCITNISLQRKKKLLTALDGPWSDSVIMFSLFS